jgi:hypothetical protein
MCAGTPCKAVIMYFNHSWDCCTVKQEHRPQSLTLCLAGKGDFSWRLPLLFNCTKNVSIKRANRISSWCFLLVFSLFGEGTSHFSTFFNLVLNIVEGVGIIDPVPCLYDGNLQVKFFDEGPLCFWKSLIYLFKNKNIS